MSEEKQAGHDAVAGPVEPIVRRLYVYNHDGSHARFTCTGQNIAVSLVFCGRVCQFTAKLEDIVLLKKVCSEVLNDFGA